MDLHKGAQLRQVLKSASPSGVWGGLAGDCWFTPHPKALKVRKEGGSIY